MSYEIVIRLTVPDGTTVRYGEEGLTDAQGRRPEPEYIAPFEDELIPLPAGAIPLPSDPVAFRAPVARQADTRAALCPIHHEPWRTVPAGISKKNGRPYDAFQACPVRGCDQRPAA